MTREEAIKRLWGKRNLGKKTREAIEMAIKALEQEPKSEWQHDHEILKAYSDGANEVLDKIRAEIENTEIKGYIRDVECYNAGINFALHIIAKYKTDEE